MAISQGPSGLPAGCNLIVSAMAIQAGVHPLLHAAPHLSLSLLLQGGARRLLTKRQLATLTRRAGRQLSAKQPEGLDDEEELDDFLAEDDKSMYMVRTVASTTAVTPPGTQPAGRWHCEGPERPHQLPWEDYHQQH